MEPKLSLTNLKYLTNEILRSNRWGSQSCTIVEGNEQLLYYTSEGNGTRWMKDLEVNLASPDWWEGTEFQNKIHPGYFKIQVHSYTPTCTKVELVW